MRCPFGAEEIGRWERGAYRNENGSVPIFFDGVDTRHLILSRRVVVRLRRSVGRQVQPSRDESLLDVDHSKLEHVGHQEYPVCQKTKSLWLVEFGIFKASIDGTRGASFLSAEKIGSIVRFGIDPIDSSRKI